MKEDMRDNRAKMMQAINGLRHEELAHKVFLGCFASAVKSGEVRGLEKSSLFRMTLAYFLFVPNARKQFLDGLDEYID